MTRHQKGQPSRKRYQRHEVLKVGVLSVSAPDAEERLFRVYSLLLRSAARATEKTAGEPGEEPRAQRRIR